MAKKANLILTFEIFHGGDCADCCILECDAVYLGN